MEKYIGNESLNVEEILCGDTDVGKDDGGKRQSVFPNVTVDGNVGDRRLSPGEEINQILREDLGRAKITSTPKKATWPIYSKRRSSVLREPDEPVCKAVVFDVASGSGTVGGIELSRGTVTDPSEGVPESVVTSGGFSIWRILLDGKRMRNVWVPALVVEEKEWCAFHRWRRCFWKKLPRRKELNIILVSRRKVY